MDAGETGPRACVAGCLVHASCVAVPASDATAASRDQPFCETTEGRREADDGLRRALRANGKRRLVTAKDAQWKQGSCRCLPHGSRGTEPWLRVQSSPGKKDSVQLQCRPASRSRTRSRTREPRKQRSDGARERESERARERARAAGAARVSARSSARRTTARAGRWRFPCTGRADLARRRARIAGRPKSHPR